MTTTEFLPEVKPSPGWQAADRDSDSRGTRTEQQLKELWLTDFDDYGYIDRPVSEKAALSIAAFFSGVTLICEAMGAMPINVYKPRKSGAWDLQRDHPVQFALNRTVNGWLTPSRFKSGMQAKLLLDGNAVGLVKRNGRGQGIAIEPVMPCNVEYFINADNSPSYGIRDYPVVGSDHNITIRGNRSNKFVEYYNEEILHFTSFSLNGYTGLSTLKQARSGLDLSLTVEAFGKKFFTKGRPAGFLTKDGRLGDKQKEVLRAEWKELQEGVHNAFNIGFLSGGWDWKSMGYTNDDAQYLATREFQVLEVARFLRIPPHMLAELGKATNSNIEELMLEFIVYTLLPWIVRQEEELDLKMFTPREQSMGFRCIYDVDAWLRGDADTRAMSSEKNIRNGITTIQEERNKMFLPEYEDNIGGKPLVIASQLDTLERVMNGTSKLHGTDKPTTKPASKPNNGGEAFGEGILNDN